MGWLDDLKAELTVGAERRAAARSQLGAPQLVEFEARFAEARRAISPNFHRVDDRVKRQVLPASAKSYAGQCWRCGVRSDYGCAHQVGNG